MLELEQSKDYVCEVGEALNHLGGFNAPLQSRCGVCRDPCLTGCTFPPIQVEPAPCKGQSFSMTGLSDLHRSMYRKLVI